MNERTRKIFAGARVRHLRQTLKLTQAVFASQLSISTSYLNQIENNQRALTASVILSLVDIFKFDLSELALDDAGRIAVDTQEILSDPVFADTPVMMQELKIAATNAPNMVKAFLHLYQIFQNTREQLGQVDNALPQFETSLAPLPFEEVRDHFHHKDNYIDELDRAAEDFSEAQLSDGPRRHDKLIEYLRDQHRISVSFARADTNAEMIRRFDEPTRTLYLNGSSSHATNLFQMAYQVGLIEQRDLIENLLDGAQFHTEGAREVCRMTFANYFAGAVVLPYTRFVTAARELRHDLDKLAFTFDASLEQVSHRLSMMQRPGQKGVPFFFVRIDRAGNITKRHSATKLQFTRFGGSCPLWNVHKAFEAPDDILRQLAVTPDGLRYLCLAFCQTKRGTSFGKLSRRHAIGLGCEVKYADQLVYADDLDTESLAKYDPIGSSCRICEREDCAHRSVPPMAKDIKVDHESRETVPFRVT